MEIIKKTVLRKMIATTSTDCNENCHILIPDLTANYYFKILLTSNSKDLGFFDVDDSDED